MGKALILHDQSCRQFFKVENANEKTRTLFFFIQSKYLIVFFICLCEFQAPKVMAMD